jgi:thioredoxin-dependent peroxiredoxin
MPNTLPGVGDTAPGFTLTDADGGTVSLSDYAGRSVVVYFYPAAMTPGCTAEACDFTAARTGLEGAGYTVLGISPDAPDKLARFRSVESLDLVLLSDPDHAVAAAYGAYGEKKLYGRTALGIIRSTFVVGPDGRLTQAWRNVKATGHVARVLSDLGVV